MERSRFWKSLVVCAVSTSLAYTAQAQNLCSRDVNGRLTAEFLRTVVITDEPGSPDNVFKDGRFSFSKTISAILASAAKRAPGANGNAITLASSKTEQIAFLAGIIRSFRNLERSKDGVRNDASERPLEANLEAAKLLSEMHPVGLFNRLDLAPASLRYCGEHRIVYARGTGTDRLFMIFEAAVDNPDSNHAATGCLRIAKFWDSMRGLPAPERPLALEKFYYQGDLGDGKGLISPVIDSNHLGVPFGQIRGNLFMTNNPGTIPWMLREWRTFPDAQSGTVVIPDTVKSNPNPELYNESVIGADHGRTQAFKDLRPEFQSQFLVSHVRELIDVDLEAAAQGRKPSGDEIFNRLSALFDDRFNDFESVSQTPPGRDEVTATQDFEQRIEQEIAKYKLPVGWGLTAKHVLARAEALSCGGCHNLTEGKAIGPAIDTIWPSALAFTHINENAQLSEALLNNFLPARCENMQNFIEEFSAQASVSQISTLPTTDAVAETRERVQDLQGMSDSDDVSDTLAELNKDILATRKDDATTAGAFRRFRRTH